MKFVSLKMRNFMRYHGEHELRFSCDPQKNVTVVLGKNTLGKSTIAQAFRWGLYGDSALISTTYVKKKEIILLNKDAIAKLLYGKTEEVSVEIRVMEGDNEWLFRRSALYKRKTSDPKDLRIEAAAEPELTMQLFAEGVPGKVINNDGTSGKEYKRGCVDDMINNILPKSLAAYFFFDGERWTDPTAPKDEVKRAIETILGITGLISMRNHLNSTSKCVLKKLRGKIQGAGDEYDRVTSDIRILEGLKERDKEEKERQEAILIPLTQKRDELFEELSNSKSAEDDIRELARLKSSISTFEHQIEENYADIVKYFSLSSKFFAASLLPEIKELLSGVNLEGKDIPGVTEDTIDYLIEKGTCLCDQCKIEEGSDIYCALMQLKKVIPPHQIGGAVAKFEATLESWGDAEKNLIEDISDKAENLDSALISIDDYRKEVDKLESRIDRKKDIAALRKNYNNHVRTCAKAEQDIKQLEFNISQYDSQLESKNNQLDQISKQNDANKNVRLQIEYAEALYKMANELVKKKVDPLANELSDLITKNFEKMFDDEEKYAILSPDDFKIHVYYKDLGGVSTHEEKVLSGGEPVAINFVYIASVLELAAMKKLQTEDVDSDNIMELPIVLDGAFSNLDDSNTNSIACKLPSFAEQIIVFILDKDWDATGLEEYTDPKYMYRVIRDHGTKNSSTIVRQEA